MCDDKHELELNYLLRLRSIIESDINLSRNNLQCLTGMNLMDTDPDTNTLYNEIRDHFNKKHSDNCDYQEAMFKKLNDLINIKCSHELVEDEIDNGLSETTIKIRYCNICEVNL